MRALIVVVITCLLLPLTGIGQPTQVAQECSRSKIFNASAKTTLASPDELKYDVRHVHIDISLDNTSVAIAGKATTTALVTEGNFALYVFELNSKLAIDSVSINGKDAVFVRTDNLVKTFMPSLLQTGDVFSATVYYHGLPDAGSVFFFQSGMNNAPAEEWNSTVTYTLSEPFNSKDWWPCKQYLEDKIDSADIWITVPDSLKAGSNGLLQRVTSLAGNKKRFEWKTTYPIAYYLLSVSVAAYDEYSFTRTMPDGKEVLVQNYLYDRQNVLDSFKNRLDTTGEMLYYFSELFGTYPFHKEKYGHCMAPVFGGMEHQTMTTLHNFNAALVAHELTHQWFGDNVTCGTWRDVWLNEGFASYGEYLFAEKFWGDTAALKYIQKVHDIVLDDTVLTGSIYMSEAEANNPYRIFDGRLSYQKASSVLHMLRYIINNDNLFFSILREYQLQFANKTATTDDFKQLAENLSGFDLQQFFDQWIYGEGYPIYSVIWNQLDDKLLLQIEQQGCVPASVRKFNMPVEIKVIFSGGDTTVRLPDGIDQYTEITIQRKIDNILFDPKDALLNKEVVNRDYALGIRNLPVDVYVYPNPAVNDWKVVNITPGSELLLTDLQGRKIWTKTATDNYGISIPAAGYARGVYLLRIMDNYNKTTSLKLIRL